MIVVCGDVSGCVVVRGDAFICVVWVYVYKLLAVAMVVVLCVCACVRVIHVMVTCRVQPCLLEAALNCCTGQSLDSCLLTPLSLSTNLPGRCSHHSQHIAVIFILFLIGKYS